MLLTSSQIAAELGLASKTINRYAENGTIPVALEKKNALRTTRRYDLKKVKEALSPEETIQDRILNQF